MLLCPLFTAHGNNEKTVKNSEMQVYELCAQINTKGAF